MFQCENGVYVVKGNVCGKPTRCYTDEKDNDRDIRSNIDSSNSEFNIQPTSSCPFFLEMASNTGDIDSDGSNTEEKKNARGFYTIFIAVCNRRDTSTTYMVCRLEQINGLISANQKNT